MMEHPLVSSGAVASGRCEVCPLTKTGIARKVADEGITVIIANGRRDHILAEIMENEELRRKHEEGSIVYTRFIPSPVPYRA